MPTLLCIESATDVCSICVSSDGQILAARDSSVARSHTELITIYIQECLASAGKSMADLDAIVLSAGPGSYTSLRVGASTAKGLCYAAGLPLITISTLAGLAEAGRDYVDGKADVIIPMLDARRMEVYHAIFDADMERLVDDEPVELVELALDSYEGRVVCVGNAIAKAQEVLSDAVRYVYVDAQADARRLVRLGEQAFAAQRYADVAYFEPNYIKPVRIIKSKKKLL